MLRWFRESAPIYRKLSIVFGMQAGMLGLCCVSETLAYAGILPQLASAGLCAGVTLFGLMTGLILREAIAGPYVATVVRMEHLAAGDTEAPIRFTGYRDCVGRMTKAMFTFRKAAFDKIAAELEAHALRLAAETHKRLEEEALAEKMAFIVGSVGGGLARLSDGHLTYRIIKILPTGYDQLRTDFNAAMENLQNTMEAVAGSTGAVRSGAAEINQASDDLSQRTEQQAASLEETAAALDEITATIRRTAEGAKEARQVVAAAKTDAERSSKVVNETVAAMSAIEISSKEIGNIIGVIDEIAFQTNLLALNAGVEAARAGDAGRGFAVVATEVRGLAQRSAEAAKQIKALIAASSTHVANGVTLVSETGRVLGRTLEQVEELDRLVGEIAASAKEQATGLGQVNTAVNQMDQFTQQNAAMVEQTTAASRSLADEAAELAQLVAEFQTGHAGIEHKTRPSERKPAAAKSRIPADAPEGRFRDAATKPASAAAAVDK
jgi:methyl-accepting chemotaxis protein